MDDVTLRAACASTERFLAGVTSGHYGLPTPCERWNVHDLLNHLLGTLSLGEALLADQPPSVDTGPGEVPGEDLVGDDPLKAYRHGVESLVNAATSEAVGRAHPTPLGEMPGTVLAGFTTLDILVHGWDLARATGQDPTLDPGLAEAVLTFARQTVSAETGTRAPRIGPEVAWPGDAPATERLVAFMGRRP